MGNRLRDEARTLEANLRLELPGLARVCPKLGLLCFLASSFGFKSFKSLSGLMYYNPRVQA